jgi:hypothetical protein
MYINGLTTQAMRKEVQQLEIWENCRFDDMQRFEFRQGFSTYSKEKWVNGEVLWQAKGL